MKSISTVLLLISLSRYSCISSFWFKKRIPQRSRSPQTSIDILNRTPTGNITYIEAEDVIIDDDIVLNSLPSRKLATRPFSWEELIDICRIKQDLSLHSRSFHDQRNYLLFKRNILDKYWTSIHDYILCDKFHFQRRLVRDHDKKYVYENVQGIETNDTAFIIGYFKEGTIFDTNTFKYSSIVRAPAGFKFCSFPPLESISDGDVRMCLAMNDYPYFVHSGIEHWCLWKLGGNVTTDDIDEALIRLKTIERNEPCKRKLLDSISFVNPPHLKSVKAIDHAHILCLWGDR
jgi:hypothetical protein